MEYPKMDGNLHLLALMHRQVEEARALGNAEPRLEFREGAAELTTRIAGTDAVEEVRYGGLYHADELVEAPGEPLRRLSDEGYVELDHAEPRGGTVTITGKGIEKMRYRRAFESNLPRSFKRWEISLLGMQQMGMMKLWRADWEGRNILVRDRWHLTLATPQERRRREFARDITEYLNVDDRFPPGYRVEKTRFSKDLYGELRARDGVHELHAHVGLTASFLRTGCLIAVDGVVIGGDVGKRFLT